MAKKANVTTKRLSHARSATRSTARSKVVAARPNLPLQRGDAGGHRWTFLTNHAHVLAVLHDDSELVLREVAVRVGITERAVQRIIQDLEEEGFIQIEKVGRQNRYQVMTDQPLRHPIESHRNIGDLLGLIAKETR